MGHMTATSSPVKARRTGGRSARVREAVLRATLDALLAGGADDLSVRDVAQRAGVHETSVYRRWGTRANLILDAVLSEVQAAVPVPDTGSLRGDLLALLSAIAAFITTPLGQVLLQLALRDDLPEDRDVRDQFWAERFTVGQTVLQRARDRGELRPGVNGQLTIETLLGGLYVRLLLTREPIDGTLTEQLVDLILAGVAAPGTALPAERTATRAAVDAATAAATQAAIDAATSAAVQAATEAAHSAGLG
jgi:AcrR family transcriptional regulator